MKIVIAGFWGWTQYEESFGKALEILGHEVIPFKTSNYFKGKVGHLQNIIPLPGPSLIKLNRDLLAFVENKKPDVLLAWRCTHILSSVIRKLNSLNIITVSYNNDDPFGPQSGIKLPWHHKLLWFNYLRNLNEFQFNFFYRPINLIEAKKKNVKNPNLLLPYYIPWKDYPIELNEEDELKYKSDIVFIGHYENDNRVSFLKALVETGYRVKLFGGSYWTKKVLNSLYDYFQPIYPVLGEEYIKALSASEICIVFLSKINRDKYTRRCFEIPAVGKLMLAERTADLLNMFEENIEACYFSSPEELVEKVNWLMNNKEIRNQIATAGHHRLMRDKHDIVNRANYFMETIVKI
jgi:spore maturation protein CgeB